LPRYVNLPPAKIGRNTPIQDIGDDFPLDGQPLYGAVEMDGKIHEHKLHCAFKREQATEQRYPFQQERSQAAIGKGAALPFSAPPRAVYRTSTPNVAGSALRYWTATLFGQVPLPLPFRMSPLKV